MTIQSPQPTQERDPVLKPPDLMESLERSYPYLHFYDPSSDRTIHNIKVEPKISFGPIFGKVFKEGRTYEGAREYLSGANESVEALTTALPSVATSQELSLIAPQHDLTKILEEPAYEAIRAKMRSLFTEYGWPEAVVHNMVGSALTKMYTTVSDLATLGVEKTIPPESKERLETAIASIEVFSDQLRKVKQQSEELQEQMKENAKRRGDLDKRTKEEIELVMELFDDNIQTPFEEGSFNALVSSYRSRLFPGFPADSHFSGDASLSSDDLEHVFTNNGPFQVDAHGSYTLSELYSLQQHGIARQMVIDLRMMGDFERSEKLKSYGESIELILRNRGIPNFRLEERLVSMSDKTLISLFAGVLIYREFTSEAGTSAEESSRTYTDFELEYDRVNREKNYPIFQSTISEDDSIVSERQRIIETRDDNNKTRQRIETQLAKLENERSVAEYDHRMALEGVRINAIASILGIPERDLPLDEYEIKRRLYLLPLTRNIVLSTLDSIPLCVRPVQGGGSILRMVDYSDRSGYEFVTQGRWVDPLARVFTRYTAGDMLKAQILALTQRSKIFSESRGVKIWGSLERPIPHPSGFEQLLTDRKAHFDDGTELVNAVIPASESTLLDAFRKRFTPEVLHQHRQLYIQTEQFLRIKATLIDKYKGLGHIRLVRVAVDGIKETRFDSINVVPDDEIVNMIVENHFQDSRSYIVYEER